MAKRTPADLFSAVSRLTETTPHGTHVWLFKLAVTSSDGQLCGISVRVGKQKVYQNDLNQLANSFRVDKDQIEEVLDSWSHEDLIDHLGRYPAEVLTSAANLRRFQEPQFQPRRG